MCKVCIAKARRGFGSLGSGLEALPLRESTVEVICITKGKHQVRSSYLQLQDRRACYLLVVRPWYGGLVRTVMGDSGGRVVYCCSRLSTATPIPSPRGS